MIQLKTLLKENVISYSAIVLDQSSMVELSKTFEHLMPEGWEWVGHHITIKLGALDEVNKAFLGKPQTATVIQYGLSDKAFAVKVNVVQEIKNIMVGPSFPHVTLAVNRSGGGKPVDSNKITKWTDCPLMDVTGTVKEIPKK